MRKWLAAIVVGIVLICATLVPMVSFTENGDAAQLARVIYTLGRNESYETKLAIGTVVMNRVDSRWFDDTMLQVLDDPHQFPCGERYDEESLKAARAVLSGTRTLDKSVLYYGTAENTAPGRTACVTSGNFNFYTTDTMLTVTGLL